MFHVSIKSRQQDNGTVRYYLKEPTYFDSLYSLITHYQSNPIMSKNFSQILTKPVPPPNQHEGMVRYNMQSGVTDSRLEVRLLQAWFQPSCSRQQAEEMLSRTTTEGAFLVRTGERVPNSFAISFRADAKVKHCLVKQEGRLYVLGTNQFESLVDLINYYAKHALYKKVGC